MPVVPELKTRAADVVSEVCLELNRSQSCSPCWKSQDQLRRLDGVDSLA